MPRSRLCGGLTLLAFIHEGISFLYPPLRAGNTSLWRRAGLVGAADSVCDGRAVIVPSKPRADASSRVSLTRTPACGPLMAKKRRRKRVEDAKSDGAAAAPEPKLQGNVASAKDTTGVKEQEQLPLPQEREVDESYSYGEDQEDEDTPTLGDILIPPLPSELGADAVRISQDLQEEDMMSPVAYQPKPDVLDVEMMDEEEAGLLDEPSTAKKSKYSFGLEVELPMESENREAGSLESALPDSPMTPDGVMPLPDLRDLAKKSRNKDRRKETKEVEEASKVERRNVEAFTKLLELDPEADSEEALFTSESYDAFSSILGEGKPFVGIANSYLQSGHTVLLGLVLLCGFVEQPGFPLTSLPYDVREFLKTGLLVVYVINTGIAILSYLEAKRVGQPVIFWAIKGFVLGGLAFNELSQIEPQKARAGDGGRKRRS